MPLYYFILKKGGQVIPDREGVELADEKAARVHATAAARDLMRNREMTTRAWRLQICDEDLQLCFELLFASLDEMLKRHPAELQSAAQRGAQQAAALSDTVSAMQMMLSQVRSTLEETNALIRRAA